MRTSERKKLLEVKYLARDSVTIIHDSVEHIILEKSPWWEAPVLVVGGVTVGVVLGAFAAIITKH
jgi:hypothetical protein